MESSYLVSLKSSGEGVTVWVPGLPGCASQGVNEQEALDDIRDAIREYLVVAEGAAMKVKLAKSCSSR